MNLNVAVKARVLLDEVVILLGSEAPDYFAAAPDVVERLSDELSREKKFFIVTKLFGYPLHCVGIPPGVLMLKSSRKSPPSMGILHHPMCPCAPPKPDIIIHLLGD
jgi:hypothetical protein